MDMGMYEIHHVKKGDTKPSVKKIKANNVWEANRIFLEQNNNCRITRIRKVNINR